MFNYFLFTFKCKSVLYIFYILHKKYGIYFQIFPIDCTTHANLLQFKTFKFRTKLFVKFQYLRS